MHVKIPVVRDQSASIPTQDSRSDAGYDLYANLSAPLTIKPGAWALVGTGLKMALPDTFCGLICPRRAPSLQKGLTVLNSPAVVDSGSRDEISVILLNLGTDTFVVEHGMRIAQMVFVQHFPAIFVPSAALADAPRGSALPPMDDH